MAPPIFPPPIIAKRIFILSLQIQLEGTVRKTEGIVLFYLLKNQQFFDHRFSGNETKNKSNQLKFQQIFVFIIFV
ncbi:uncharacterized protein METZ01_LOCUS105808 [marine metagenome]|uniref:Uncharacterized protein n=1 Tax=marine metagenome TaxID=408172 RepID=A0A381WKB7_9ZZZZ